MQERNPHRLERLVVLAAKHVFGKPIPRRHPLFQQRQPRYGRALLHRPQQPGGNAAFGRLRQPALSHDRRMNLPRLSRRHPQVPGRWCNCSAVRSFSRIGIEELRSYSPRPSAGSGRLCFSITDQRIRHTTIPAMFANATVHRPASRVFDTRRVPALRTACGGYVSARNTTCARHLPINGAM